MPPRRKKKHKVVARRTRVAYRWRSFTERVVLLLKGVVFVGSAIGLAWGAHWVWEKTALLTISQVQVDGPVLPGWVESPPVKVGQALFSFSAGRVERRLLERYPQLESVHIQRRLDRGVSVRLGLRTPVAKMAVDKDRWNGVDAGGSFFPLEGEGVKLPIFSLPAKGKETAAALAFLAALRATKESWTDRLYKLKISTDGEGILFLEGDIPLHWGEVNTDSGLVARKVRRVGRVLAAPEAANGIEYARFVDDRRVVIKPRPAVSRKKETHG
jgi:cell division septal protein FtsQ